MNFLLFKLRFISLFLLLMLTISINKDFYTIADKSLCSTLNLSSKFGKKKILEILESEGYEYFLEDPKDLEKSFTAKIFNENIGNKINLQFSELQERVQDFLIYIAVDKCFIELLELTGENKKVLLETILPVLIKVYKKDFLKLNLDILFNAAKKCKINTVYLFSDLSLIKSIIKNRKVLEIGIEQLIKLGEYEYYNEDVEYFTVGYQVYDNKFKNTFTYEKFFNTTLFSMKYKYDDKVEKNWKFFLKLGNKGKNNTRLAFLYGLMHVEGKGLINDLKDLEKIVDIFISLGEKAEEYNEEFIKDYLNSISYFIKSIEDLKETELEIEDFKRDCRFRDNFRVLVKFAENKILNNKKGVLSNKDIDQLFEHEYFKDIKGDERYRVLLNAMHLVMPVREDYAQDKLIDLIKKFMDKNKHDKVKVYQDLKDRDFSSKEDYIAIKIKGLDDTEKIIDKHKLEFRVLKIPLWGQNTLFIGKDVELWAQDNFYTLAIIDKTVGKIRGFVSLQEENIAGEKVLLIRSIDFGGDLLEHIKPKTLYNMAIRAVQRVANIRQCKYMAILGVKNYPIISSDERIKDLVDKQGCEFKVVKDVDFFPKSFLNIPEKGIFKLREDIIEDQVIDGFKEFAKSDIKLEDVWLQEKVNKVKRELRKENISLLKESYDNRQGEIYVEKITKFKDPQHKEMIKEVIEKMNKLKVDDSKTNWVDINVEILDEIDGRSDTCLYLIKRKKDQKEEFLGFAFVDDPYIRYIKTKIRRQGVGTKLLEYIINDLMKVIFYVDSRNLGAIKFYESFRDLGYDVSETYYNGLTSSYQYHISLKKREVADEKLTTIVRKIVTFKGIPVDDLIEKVVKGKRVPGQLIKRIEKSLMSFIRQNPNHPNLLKGVTALLHSV